MERSLFMKILVMSDTHGDVNLVNEVLLENGDCDLVLHCGDICVDPSYIYGNLLIVKGNCDRFSNFPLTRDIEVLGKKIHFEHGHRYGALKYENIEKLGCDIFLFGHTHCRLADKYKNTYIFNPGSLVRPRDGSKGTYLILTIDDFTKELSYEFKEVTL